jgi:hypothetical protein
MPFIELPEVAKRNGEEPFTFRDQPLPLTLETFWSWACSDLLNNRMRGVLAEFLVASALGAESGYRQAWDAFDLETARGVRIEVKSSAYLQNWLQERHSRISFGIQPTKGWDDRTNQYDDERKRHADLYVFCVLREKDPRKIDPTCLEQWDFYLLETRVLDEELGGQKTLGLRSLLALQPVKTDYQHLAEAVRRLEEKIVSSKLEIEG